MSKLKPITHLTAVEWRCPFCGTGNGIPEIAVCACGAKRVGDSAQAPAAPATPPNRVATPQRAASKSPAK